MKKKFFMRIVAAFLSLAIVFTSVDVNAFVVYAEQLDASEMQEVVSESEDTVVWPEFLLDSCKVELTPGDSIELTCNVPDGSNVEWSVDNLEIAAVEKGVLIARAPGETTLTVKAEYGGVVKEEQATVLVNAPAKLRSVSGSIVYNDYIGVAANTSNFAIGTYEGNPNSTTDNNKTLLYGWSGTGTSRMFGYIDGSLVNVTTNNTYDGTNNVISGTCTSGDITFEREYRIVQGGGTGNEDVIEISVNAVNNGTSAHTVGLRMAFDTMLGSNDRAPFYVPGVGETSTQIQLTGDQIPQYWQAFDSLTSPTVIAQGTLYRNLSERPDVVVFGNYGNIINSTWTPVVSTGSANNDSAVSLRWNAETLEAGESRTYKTWYGIGSMQVDTSSLISLSLTGDRTAIINDEGTGYNDITVSAYLNNTSEETIENVSATLELPETIILAENSGEATQTIASMAPGETQMVSWIVSCIPSETGGEYDFSVSIEANEMMPAAINSSITVPVLDLIAPRFENVSFDHDIYGTAVELNWTAATDPNGVLEYHVLRSGNELSYWTDTNSFIDEHVRLGKTYCYEITAVDPYGNESDPIVTEITTIAPEIQMPSETLYGGSEVVNVDFRVKYAGAVGTGSTFVKYRKSGTEDEWKELSVIQELISEKELLVRAQWEVLELTSGDYDFEITAVDKYDTQVQDMVVLKLDRTAPEAPEYISAIGDINCIGISWSMAREYDVTGYNIYRRQQESDPWEKIASINGRASLGYTDKEIVNEVEYQYVITAVDKFKQESAYSSVVIGMGENDDEVPTVTTMSPAKNTSVSGSISISAEASDNIGVEKIIYYYSLDNGSTWIVFDETRGSSGNIVLDTTALEDGVIKIKPEAVDVNGNVSSGNLIYDYYIDNTPPSKVEGLTHTSVSTVITLNWSDVPESDLSYFAVEQLINGEYKEIKKVSNARGVNITGLLPDTEYSFRVIAVDKQGNKGEASDVYTASTITDVTAPVITRISPSAGYHNNDISLNITAEDDYAVASLDIQISTDAANWTTIYTENITGTNKSKTVTYTLDISTLNEGSIYVRGIAKDIAGNSGDESEKAPYVQYVIDRIAPEIPENLKAEASGSSINVSWDNSTSNDVKGFNLYRAATIDGTYTKIGSGIQNINYYDRAIEFDTEYFYKVSAYDNAANESALSAPVSGIVLTSEDETKPILQSIYPVDRSTIGVGNANISVLATDDFAVDYIQVEYGEAGLLGNIKDSVFVEISEDGTSSDLRGIVEIPVADYESGTEIIVKAEAYDLSGNKSNVEKVIYTIDNTAPIIENLTAQYEDNKITLEWTGGAETDLNGYLIYRKEGNGTYSKIGQRAKNGTDYLFYDTKLESGKSYQYKVVAVDMVNNKATAETDVVTTPIINVIKAVFNSDTVIQVGAECMFDGTASTSDLRIISYKFDFGDGTFSEEAKPIHVYETSGSYKVELTVTDIEGNTDTCYQTIYVQERKTLGILKVKVVDDSGNALSNTPVYFDMEGANTIKSTDNNGYVEFSAMSGNYKVGSYRTEYLPATKSVTLVGGSLREIQLVLVEHPIVTGEFEIQRMTLDEVKAAGIDISEPANQQVMKLNIHLTYGTKEQDLSFFVNGNGIIIGDNNFIIRDEDGEEDRKGTVNVIPVPGPDHDDDENVIVAIMDVPVEASFLKEFFNVNLHIINHADTQFCLKDNLVHLNVPEGMTIMEEGEVSTPDAAFDTLYGQQQKTLNWILRGDEAGDYELTADYSSVLDVFNEEVSAVFKSENIHVYGSDAVKIKIDINRSIRYQTMYFDLGMENVCGVDLYMPSMSVMEAAIQDLLIDLEEGEDNVEEKAVTQLGIRLENTAGYRTYITEDPDKLSSGETLYHEYVIYNAISDADTAWLRQVVINNLENIGVDNIEVTVTDMDLYEVTDDEDAQMKVEALYGENASAFQSLYEGSNYEYYTFSDTRNNSFMHGVGEFGHGLADAVLTLNFDHFTKEDKKEFMRNIVGEMMADETVNQQMLQKIDDQYIKSAEKMISSLDSLAKATLSDSDYESYGIGAVINTLSTQKNVNKLANDLKQDGVSDDFTDRLITLAGTTATAGFIEFVKATNQPEVGSFSEMASDILSEGITSAIGTCSDILGTASNVIQEWNDSIEMANILMQLKAVEEESKFLLNHLIEYAEQSSSTKWIADEARDLITDIEEKCASQRLAFVNMLQENLLKYTGEEITKAIIKTSVKSLTKHFFGAATATSIGVIYQMVCIIYGIVDSTFGWSTYFNAYDKMLTVMLISVYMGYTYDEYYSVSDYQNALRSLKYLIKTRAIGERTYAEYLESDEDAKEAFLEQSEWEDVNSFLSSKLEQITRNRDKIFQTKATTPDVPEAPQVTFNYKTGKTEESFNQNYEYSLNYGETWQTCEGQIAIEEKTTSQMLYVREKASSANLAGNIADIAIAAKPRTKLSPVVEFNNDVYTITGMKADAAYELYLSSNAQMDEVDWTQAITAVSNANGCVEIQGDACNYIIYRTAATEVAFASVPNFVKADCTATITLTVDGVGYVEVNGERYTGGTHKKGTYVAMKAVYESSHLFNGWYDNAGNCISTEDQYIVEVQEDKEIVAKFNPVTRYTIDVQSADAAQGTVTGSGQYAAGTNVLVNAVAKSGYRFIGWYEGNHLVSTNCQYLFVAGADVSLMAKFEKTVEKMTLKVSYENSQIQYRSGADQDTWSGEEGSVEKELDANASVTLTAKAEDGYKFVYWMDMANNRILTEAQTYTFNMYSNMSVKAVSSKIIEKTIIFKNNEKFSSKEIARETVAIGTEVTVPTPIAYEGYKFVGWDIDGNGTVDKGAAVTSVVVDEDMTWIAIYEVDEIYTIHVTNGKIVKVNGKKANLTDGTYEKDTVLVVKADEAEHGKYFVGWSIDGGNTLIGANEQYEFYLLQDLELEAIYSETEVVQMPTVNFAIQTRTRDVGTGKDKIRMGITWDAVDGYKIVEEGILRTYSEAARDDLYVGNTNSNVKQHICSKVSQTGSYTYNLTIGNTSDNLTKDVYAIGYITCKDAAGNLYTIYTEEVCIEALN